MKEADEKAEAEAALDETSDNLRPINDSDPEVTFLNDSKFINESELKICFSLCLFIGLFVNNEGTVFYAVLM